MPHVEIYSKAFCPYCSRAKALLDSKGVGYEVHDITMGGARRAEMIERSDGRQTVPQVFIGGTHIGGSDDLAAADLSGELDKLLAAG
jgi:glutaredoxin 3